MSADVIDLLRAADPVDGMPKTSGDDRERLRRTIISSSGDQFQRARRRRRRAVFAAIAIGAVLLAGGTAVYATKVVAPPLPPLAPAPTPAADTLMTARQVHAEYRRWTHKIDLPRGVKWPHERLPKGPGGYGDTYGGNTGVMDAIKWAWHVWSLEWIAAAKAGDEVRSAAAAAELERLCSVMPVWHEGMTENQGGWDSADIDTFRLDIEAAKQGDFSGLRYIAYLWFGSGK